MALLPGLFLFLAQLLPPVTPPGGGGVVDLRTPPDLSTLYAAVSPSVVVVRTRERGVAPRGEEVLTTYEGVGSGFIVSLDGRVMTAAHVVHTADAITVELADGQTSPAFVIASNPRADIALLQMEAMPEVETALILGDSDAARIGDPVFIVGAPYGMGHTLTVGHLSGRRESGDSTGVFTRVEYLQTDAAINLGNSGGPLFNLKGEVIGICSHILSRSGGFEGLGFAATSNLARELLLERRSFWTGTETFLLENDWAEMFNVPQAMGVLVQRVAADSPAAQMGVRGGYRRATIADEELLLGGDIILSVMGIPIEGTATYNAMMEAVHAVPTGGRLYVEVLRGGQVLTLSTIKLPVP